MKLYLSILANILCGSLNAQTIKKENTTVIVRNLHGDIVEGNKITKNYYFKNPKITIYPNPLERRLILYSDSIFWDRTKFVTILQFSEVDFRLLTHPSFKLSFSEAVDSVNYAIASRSNAISTNNIYSVLSTDKKSYSFVSDDLCAECVIDIRIFSKRPVDVKLKL